MSRLIDQENAVRTTPMRVCCLGMCRTGTLSLYSALQTLGYRPYHFMETLLHGERDFPLVTEAWDAKFNGTCKPYGREEFDKWYGDYDAIADIPASLFADELLVAYPDAKFILTDRDPDAWMASMHKTVFASSTNRAIWYQKWVDWKYTWPMDKSLQMFMKVWSNFDTGDKARQAYIDHVAHVKAIVPPEKLLVLKLEDGFTWEKLCTFLDKPIPDQPYPRGHGAEAFNKLLQQMGQDALMRAVKRWLVYLTPVIAFGALYYMPQRGRLRLPWI
ncbi:uncharacterized protein K452DRAFT_351759 [Aplosporella prunicola CBS 121167]|uniref:Sulfotransferase domain-containing protein n=1 Tax=Aplosporella prunicola CBS 121167 TaxID=1176127 RepID=A0A6A6B8D0_9PEZI|nr:uncharacterized protein K452DRAFT_351759 [Aplosporella prunicola CBS 121167]KAF2140472.1 hypothetical protein K452DRAFT_351759 [Aplosporella prunicola CBS 121167]